MSTIKTKNIKQTVIGSTTQPLKIGGILDDGSDAKISIDSDGTTTVVGTGQLIAEYVVSGSAVTSVNFSGLDINSHKSYRIEFDHSNPVGTFSNIYMYINGDTTNTNYYSQFSYAGSTNLSASREASPSILATAANAKHSGTINLRLTEGYATAFATMLQSNGSGLELLNKTYSKVSTVSNITQLTFTATTANSIGIGSKVRIYRG